MTNIATERRDSILTVVGYWILFLTLLILVSAQSGATFPTHVHRFTISLFGVVIALFVTWTFIKLERNSWVEYYLVWGRETIPNFFKGLIIGMASIALITVIQVLLGGLEIQRNPAEINPWALLWYLTILPAAFMEEIAFRSYPFLKLNKTLGLRLTQLIVSIIFALYHMPFGWNPLTAFLGPGIWAWIFGIAAIRSKGIAIPTGIHVGLNLTLSVLGMRHGVESILVASQNESTSNTITNLAIRILILLTGILLTEYSIRKSKERS